ncbi:hypothetical protein [Ferrovibrio sp.]|uniref:hypothetical protein n=1 Tax=Ferrovibrio sp. TaxID=1917215 RepID=UPI003D128ABF
MEEDIEAIDQRIRRLAGLSVGRGCFFAALAIWCTMIGLIYEPVLSLKSGAILTMLVAAVLVLKAQIVRRASYKHTEVWILLGRQIDLLPVHAQRLIAQALHETYLRYALFAMLLAVLFWGLALLFSVAGKAA